MLVLRALRGRSPSPLLRLCHDQVGEVTQCHGALQVQHSKRELEAALAALEALDGPAAAAARRPSPAAHRTAPAPA